MTTISAQDGPTPEQNAAFDAAMKAFSASINTYHGVVVKHLVITFNPSSDDGSDFHTYHVSTNIDSENLPRVLELLDHTFKAFGMVIALHESRGATKQ